MILRISVLVYIFIVSTIELTVAGRSLRLDLGSLGYLFWKRPIWLFMVPPALLFGYVLGGVNGVISCILIVAPFAAYFFGKSITVTSEPGLRRFFWFLCLLAIAQWLVGNDIVGFLYDGDGENHLPHAILASEPSFAFEALFAQALLLLVLTNGRRAWWPLLAILALSVVTNVMTVWQNSIVLLLAIAFSKLPFSRMKSVVAFACFFPTLLIYAFPEFFVDLGYYVLFQFGSWRQLSNAISIGMAGWYETLFFNYRELVGGILWDMRSYNLYDWIVSAFSWFPFVHSIGGRVLAVPLFVLIALNLPNPRNLTWKERAVLVASLIIFLYTAPKWQFFGMITAGAVCGLAERRTLGTDGSAAKLTKSRRGLRRGVDPKPLAVSK